MPPRVSDLAPKGVVQTSILSSIDAELRMSSISNAVAAGAGVALCAAGLGIVGSTPTTQPAAKTAKMIMLIVIGVAGLAIGTVMVVSIFKANKLKK